MKNKKNKILIMNIGSTENIMRFNFITNLIKEINPQIDICLATGENNKYNNESILKTHIYPIINKQDIFVKRLFAELKFIFSIKKEKYKIAIVINQSNKNIIIAKYAKIKNIIGYKTNNKKINNLITHKILPNSDKSIENQIIEALKCVKNI